MNSSKFILASLAFPVLFAQPGLSTGSISGRMLAPDSRPVRAVLTLMGQSSASRPRTVVTNADGSYRFDLLGPGIYSICAQVGLEQARSVDEPILDTCEWSGLATSVTLKRGEAVSNVQILGRIGTLLRIRVNDPVRRLPPPRSAIDLNPLLIITVKSADNLLHHPRVAAADPGGRDYAIALPHDTALFVSFQSKGLSLKDEIGRLIAQDLGLNVPLASKAGRISITIQ